MADVLLNRMLEDPRVLQLLQSRRRGSIPGVIRTEELRQLGYDVPDGYKLRDSDARTPNPVLHQEGDAWDLGIGIGAGALMGTGIAGLAGVGPLAGSGGATGGTSAGLGSVSGTYAPFGSAPAASQSAIAANMAPFGSAPMASPSITSGLAPFGGAGAASAAGSAAAAGGGALAAGIKNFLGDNWQDLLGAGIAGGNAIRGLTQGPTQAEQDLSRILKLAEGRINSSEPLFNALQSYALGSMPKYTRGEQ